MRRWRQTSTLENDAVMCTKQKSKLFFYQDFTCCVGGELFSSYSTKIFVDGHLQ